jgi:hypothetical protein
MPVLSKFITHQLISIKVRNKLSSAVPHYHTDKSEKFLLTQIEPPNSALKRERSRSAFWQMVYPDGYCH